MGINMKEGGECQPICDCCGVSLCWSISDVDYLEYKGFWDVWKCRDCNPSYSGALEEYKKHNEPFKEIKEAIKKD